MFPVAIMASRAQVTLPGGADYPSLLNAQKLSLPANTPLGTRVKVTDGFVVSGADDPLVNAPFANGLYVAAGTGDFQEPIYRQVNLSTGLGEDDRFYVIATDTYPGGLRYIIRSVNTGEIAHATADAEDGYTILPPWLYSWPALTLTHPAVQELTAPSTAQGGVFVSGGSQGGIYTIRGDYLGKKFHNLLGNSDQIDGNESIYWDGSSWKVTEIDGTPLYYSLSSVATPDLAGSDKFVMAVSGVAYSKRGTFNGKSYYNKIGETTSTSLSAIFWSSATWHITNAIGVDLDTSTSAVATPDLATFLLGTVVTNTAWLNASDDSPASITVTSVTQGELDAGVLVAGAGTSARNQTFTLSGSLDGLGNYLSTTTSEQINYDSGWLITASTSSYLGEPPKTAFPWQANITIVTGAEPDPTVTRDDVASEANWAVVP